MKDVDQQLSLGNTHNNQSSFSWGFINISLDGISWWQFLCQINSPLLELHKTKPLVYFWPSIMAVSSLPWRIGNPWDLNLCLLLSLSLSVFAKTRRIAVNYFFLIMSFWPKFPLKFLSTDFVLCFSFFNQNKTNNKSSSSSSLLYGGEMTLPASVGWAKNDG